MCGINGFTFSDESLIKRMNKITDHRGPDDTGFFISDGISLGNNRLKIIDLSDNASQPMTDASGRYTIVYNGELYNFKELKRELDYPFKTKSDTEVVLAAYKKWGKESLKKFNGMFAFAVWDSKEKELFLARDHSGIKPLYYFHRGQTLIFSSEIKGILEHGIPRILSRQSMEHYFRLGYVPGPMTIFKDIFKFPSANYAFFRDGSLEIKNYWHVKLGQHIKEDSREIEERIRSLLYESVKSQLVSDRPVGLYLSGGIDSSVMLHNMASARHNKVSSFSVGFDLGEDEGAEKFNADFFLARKTAACYGTDHHEVLVSSDDVINLFEKLVWYLDEPISNPTTLAMFKLAGYAKENGVDVVLGGDGGDELFGGYKRYRLSRAADLYQSFTPPYVREALSFNDGLSKLNTPPGIERFKLFEFEKDAILNEVLSGGIGRKTEKFFKRRYFGRPGVSFEEEFMDTDRRTWLTDDSLMRSDRTTMAFGLEARVPFLTPSLTEFAMRISPRQKISPFNTKMILKRAYRDRLPSHLYGEKKRGWVSPGAKWLRHEKVEVFAREILQSGYNKETAGLFKWNAIEDILDKHITGERYNLLIIWQILTFQLWAKRYNIKIN